MKKYTLPVVMVMCLMMVPVTTFAVDINYPDFSDLSDFTLGANAQSLNTVPDDILQLASGTWQRSGYAYLTNQIKLENTFSTYFSFRIDNNVGGGDADGLGADWLMFLLKREIGYYAAEDVAIEFDIFNNGSRDNYSGNHVGINYGGQFVVTQHIDQRFNDGDIWHVWIDYDGSILAVYISLAALKPATPALTHTVDIANYFSDSDPYIGFQAASGAYGADFAILNWSFESIESVTCPEDTTPPLGAVHAYPNLIWPPNDKMVTVTLEGYLMDEMSIARDSGGIGISSAKLIIDNSNEIILRDHEVDLLDSNGNFSADIQVRATEGAEYLIELHAADTNPEAVNSGLVDKTLIRVPRNMDKKDD
jgi:hypothetical protein